MRGTYENHASVPAVKYLVTVTQGVTVEADSPKEAEAHALIRIDGGFASILAVEVEQLTRETREA